MNTAVSGGESADAIDRAPTGITAFVGRTLKGPVNEPVAVGSLAEFQQRFGGLWQPATLSYAVEQYFEMGGRRAVIVRVANGARAPTLTLPAGGGRLTLTGVNPGSREYLRAAVDYDGISPSEPERFNLIVQRVRMPGSELIEQQEILRRLSVEPDSPRFITRVLEQSPLVRTLGEVPRARPERTSASPGGPLARYVASNHDGDDGAPLSDYDVIGSTARATGLFALKPEVDCDLVCIPPLSREQDVGMSTLLVAARLCRERNAMLVVDPPAAWTSTSAALEAVRTWPFRSDNAVMFFPRVLAFDRLRNRFETFGSSAAAAGFMARSDQSSGAWTAAPPEDAVLRPGLRPLVTVADVERARLAQAGINTLQAVRSSARQGAHARTLASGCAGSSGGRYLPSRRLALHIVASVERGTRWLIEEPNAPDAWARAQAQVADFLASLDRRGAFVGERAEERYFVICDERVNRPQTIAEGKVNLLVGFAMVRPGEFYTSLITQEAFGSRSRPVAVNRLATARQRVEWEIETSILRS